MIYLANDKPGQRHAGDGADEFDAAAVVNVAVAHSELLALRLVVVHWRIFEIRLSYTKKSIIYNNKAVRQTNAPIGEWKCNFPPFVEL